MKVCYIDETGTDGKSPVIVIAGILVDAIRLGATRDEFQKHLIAAQDTLGKSPREIKGVELYKKRNQWRNIQGTERHKLFEDLCKLVVERKHEIVLSAVDLERARSSPIEGGLSPWVSAGLHVSLQVQRRTQKIKNRKGDSLLVFDQHKELTKLNDLIGEPPA